MYLDPAKSIIDRIGVDTVASITSRHRSRIYRWAYPKERGGTGGVIPNGPARRILAYAQANRIKLDPSEFLATPRPATNMRAA